MVVFALVAIRTSRAERPPDFTRFNAHDSEMYLTLAWNWRPRYTRYRDGVYIPHTTWPPTPVLMVPAVLIGGRPQWYAVKWTKGLRVSPACC
jgi:hypothetical protein